MGSEENTDPYDLVKSALNEIIKTWIDLVLRESKKREAKLAAIALGSYINGLAKMQQIGTWQTFLPACFEIYASCVGSILSECVDFKSIEHTTCITTILTKPLARWYNISVEVQSGRKCALTRSTWEDYKKRVTQLMTRGGEKIHNIQMRRIVVEGILEDAKPLWLYVGNNGPMRVEQACLIDRPEQISLLKDVKNCLEEGDPKWLIHLIGRTGNLGASDKKSLRKEGWMPIIEHFRHSYHDKTHSRKKRIKTGEKGVFLLAVPEIGDATQYEDIFIVDMASSGEGKFAIAYEEDRQRELSGILFLGDEEIQPYLGEFNELWKKPKT